MVEWQITHYIEQKLACKNKKRVFRSPRQQHAAPAHELNDLKLIDGTITFLTAGESNDLIDGKYEKTTYVKTWVGRTITAEISPEHTTKIVKGKIEAKVGIRTDDQQLVARGKVLTDNTPLKEYGISGGETIEMTAKLLGGTKHKSPSLTPMDTERDKKAKNPNHILM